MKVLFMGRKPAASLALRHLVDTGAEVVAVVAPQHPVESSTATFWRPLLRETARELGIPVLRDEEVYRALEGGGLLPGGQGLAGVDLVVSFLFWKRIRKPLLDLPRVGCFNFHPAPLPGFRGRRGYNFAILEGEAEYGASCHWVSERFDEGELVEVRRFPIAPLETAYSLEQKTMRVLLEMFEDFVAKVASGAEVPRLPQCLGRSASRAEMLAAMKVDLSEDPEVLGRRVRAFWYPPHHGAYVEVAGKRYTLVDEGTLNLLGRYLHGSRQKPC
jgi:methionyl-tRNA formyltransferase